MHAGDVDINITVLDCSGGGYNRRGFVPGNCAPCFGF
jgi:hypothetical protein